MGKTALALALAERHGAAIISADSMQVYRGIPIGTAQPTAAELARVPHHLVGHWEPGREYNVALFVEQANAVLDACQRLGQPVLVCGGTGLFLKHLIQGIFPGAPRSDEIRARLQEELDAHGPAALRERLRLVDPRREAEINPNDTMRVLRALEVYELTGRPMSEHHADDAGQRRPRAAHYVVLTRERDALNSRIEQRVDASLAAGWLDEARWLMELGLPDNAQACKALGYRELFRVLRGEWSLEEATAEIKKQTRRFAKRQRTWFRSVAGATWIGLDGLTPEEALEKADAVLFP